MFPELSAWGYAGGLADDSRPRIARIGTDIRTSKGEMRGSLHCGGKSAAFGRDDETFVLDSLGLVEMARFCAGFAGRGEMTKALCCVRGSGRDDEVLCWVRGSGGGDEVVWLATNLRVCDEFSMGMRG